MSDIRMNPLALLTSVVAGGALFLAACTGSEPTATPTPQAAATTATAAATTPAPTKAAETAAPTKAAAATGATGATAGATTVKLAKVDGKDALVDARGMTLYIFKNDVAGNGKSVCNGQCATNWPPLKAADAAPTKGTGIAGDLTVVTRDDGSKQIAYKGLPLYFWVGDTAPGDAKGAAINNWALALP